MACTLNDAQRAVWRGTRAIDKRARRIWIVDRIALTVYDEHGLVTCKVVADVVHVLEPAATLQKIVDLAEGTDQRRTERAVVLQERTSGFVGGDALEVQLGVDAHVGQPACEYRRQTRDRPRWLRVAVQLNERRRSREARDPRTVLPVTRVVQHNAATHRVAKQNQWCVGGRAAVQAQRDKMVQVVEHEPLIGQPAQLSRGRHAGAALVEHEAFVALERQLVHETVVDLCVFAEAVHDEHKRFGLCGLRGPPHVCKLGAVVIFVLDLGHGCLALVRVRIRHWRCGCFPLWCATCYDGLLFIVS